MSDAMTKEEAAQFEEMRRADAEAEAAERDAPPPPEPRREPEPPPQRESTAIIDEPAAEPDATGRVDKRALDEARIAARQLREQLQREQTQHAEAMARLDERFRLLQGAVEQHTAQPKPPPPDFHTDPAGYVQQGIRSHEEQLAAVNQRITQWEAQQRQEREEAELRNWGVAQELQFAQQQPDYAQATQYLREARQKMLRAMGETDEARINQQVLMDVASMAVRARAMGLNFGKSLYDLALAHGYQPQQQPPAPVNGDYSNMAPQRAPTAGVSAAERLARGTDMATTLGATGAGARGEPAAAHIAAMSEDEFARYYADVQKKGRSALQNLLGA